MDGRAHTQAGDANKVGGPDEFVYRESRIGAQYQARAQCRSRDDNFLGPVSARA
jgi:hypothetical protein